MAKKSYLDFDLLIERAKDGYRARVLYSPAGQAASEFTLPFNEQELTIFLLKMGRTGKGVRRMESQESELVKDFGGKLYRSIFSDSVLSSLISSLDEADEQGAGLRIRLRLDAPELVNLPWEYLYNPALNRFFSLSRDTTIVRYLEVPERIRPLQVHPPLKMLAMISSPKDYEELDVEREWNNLLKAVGGLEQEHLIQIDRLETASLSALRHKLLHNEYHIIHFIGHGVFDENTQDGMLLFENEAHNGVPVSGQDLGIILQDYDSLRLAVINACEGARTSASDPFAGVAQSLVQQCIPAVIAMQFQVSDKAAITFAQTFYTCITAGFTVDSALNEARRAIFAEYKSVEWGTPVLFMRAPDGKIFTLDQPARTVSPTAQPHTPVREIAQPVEQPPSPRGEELKPVRLDDRADSRWKEIDALLTEARTAAVRENWDAAISKFEQVLNLDPGSLQARQELADALQNRQKKRGGEIYKEAVAAARSNHWDLAARKLEETLSADPSHPTARNDLQVAQKKAQTYPLCNEAQQALKEENWALAIVRLKTILQIDPGYPKAKDDLKLAEQRQKIDSLYREIRSEKEQGNWQAVVVKLQGVLAVDGSYAPARADLLEAQRQLQEQQQRKAGALLVEAEWALKAGDYPTAVTRLNEIIRLEPAHPQARDLLEQAQAAQRQEQVDALLAEARSAEQNGDLRLAIIRTQDAILADPNQAEARTDLIRLQQLFLEAYPGQPLPQAEQKQEQQPAKPQGSERTYRVSGFDVYALAEELKTYFIRQNYKTQVLPSDTGVIVQGQKGSRWKSLVGLSNAATVILEPTLEGVKVSVGGGKWLEQGAVLAVSMFVLWPLALTGGYGMLQQKELMDTLWRLVEGHVEARGGVREQGE